MEKCARERETEGGKGSKLRSSKGENFRYRAASDALPSERRDAARRPTVVSQTRHGCLVHWPVFVTAAALRARPSKDPRILPPRLSLLSSFPLFSRVATKSHLGKTFQP